MDRSPWVDEISDKLRPSTLRVRLVVPDDMVVELCLPVLPRNGEVVHVKGRHYVVVAHNWHVDVGVFGDYVVSVDIILSAHTHNGS